MADIYSNQQARRLFGFIAAGGTVGALTGPLITTVFVETMGMANLLLLSALFLTGSVICIVRLSDCATASVQRPQQDSLIGGGVWDGLILAIRSPYLLGICLLMILLTTLATFLYFMQAHIIQEAFSDSAKRTSLFALIDLSVNSLTLLLQIFLTGRLVKWCGLPLVLALIPVLLAFGFLVLSFSPVLAVLIVVQVIRRAGNYAIMKPTREMLYVVLSREEKYKAKNLIDTLVYRLGDAMSAWVYAALRSAGLSLSTVALIAVPLAMSWAWLAIRLGRQQERIASKQTDTMQ